MTKLNQIVAIESGVKNTSYARFQELHKDAQKTTPFAGISRTYQPKDDEGDRLPPESTKVQLRGNVLLSEVAKVLTRLFDVTATKNAANTHARADVVVEDNVLLANVPVSQLLFYEKQLKDLRTFALKLPVLDPSEEWEWDRASESWRSKSYDTVRSQKVPKAFEKAKATDKHPAQVDTYFADIPVGTWTTTKFSGALPQEQVTALVERIERLQRAVKYAREQANLSEVTDVHQGQAIFDYLLER